MPEVSGQSFGPYQVISSIGAGGMGEVFKARDTRLDRIVALKVSRAQFSDRFQREARVIAALNHPHIATLYDVGPEYLVMEYVDGEILSGPLPMPRAILIAGEILEALEAAHAKGIVHRDLKPANVMIAKGGVKLLDFGLAQMKTAAPVNDMTASMTVTSEGSIAGTLQYMAPEQLQGKDVDARSDIFAFGAVLYEMVTGRKAFQGENAATVISKIMTAEPPPITELQPDVPPSIERVIRLCLKKDPDERWQSARDIRHVLEVAEPAIPAPVAQLARPSSHNWWTPAAFLFGLLVAAAGFRLVQPKPPDPPTFRPLTYSGRAYVPSLSPDGKQIAYVWSGEKNNDFDLYVQLVSGGNPLRLKANPTGKAAWSADGSRLAFTRRNGLYVMPALGGSPKRIASPPDGSFASSVAWAPDGAFFVVVTGKPGLSLVPGDGGKLRDLTNPPGADDHSPAISPDNGTVAFVRHTSNYNSQLFVLPVGRDGSAAGEPKQITNGVWDIGEVDWSPDGKEILFAGSPGSNNPTLWRVPRQGGKPVRLIVPGLGRRAGLPPRFTRGRLAYVSSENETKIFKLALNGHDAPQPLVEAIGDHSDLSVSPDGSRIAFASNRTGTKELWLADADGGHQSQLTSFNGPSVGSPRWSPDGKWIAFDGYASGSSDIYLVAADGGNPFQLTSDKSNEVRPGWSHDGKWIYYSSDAGGDRQIFKIPQAGGKPVRVTRGYNAFESNDGKWLYVLNDGQLYRMLPDGTDTDCSTHQRNRIESVDDRRKEFIRVRFGASTVAMEGAVWNARDFEKVYQFSDSNHPELGGLCFAVPNDESYVIFRRSTRESTTLMLMEGYR